MSYRKHLMTSNEPPSELYKAAEAGTDAISRNALINKLEQWQKQDGYDNEAWNLLVDVITEIKNMPLATDINVATKDGTDCISREQAIEAVRATLLAWSYMPEWRDNKIIEAVEQLPPIQPDIVRCKDCKHWIPYDWMFSEVWESKNIADYPEDEIGCEWSDMSMKANDFCSRAERREVTT